MEDNSRQPEMEREYSAGIHRNGMNGVTGLPSGFPSLDQQTSGWRPGEVFTIVGDMSIGKTTLAINMMASMALDHNIGVLFFNLESNRLQFSFRLAAAECRANYIGMSKGLLNKTEWAVLREMIPKMQAAPWILEDRQRTFDEIAATIISYAADKEVQAVFIDQIQLIECGHELALGADFNKTVARYVRQLKNLARQLQITIILVAPLSRFIKKEEAMDLAMKRCPDVNTLFSEKSIAEDSDVVLFLHRPDHYPLMEFLYGSEIRGKAVLYGVKVRNDKQFAITMYFDKEHMRFTERQEDKEGTQ